MTSNRRTDAKSGMLAFDEEAGRKLEAIYLTGEAAARRQALRGALNLQPGEQGLYIGSGPGLAPCEIAQALGPAGRLGVVEKNAAMLAMTERRAARNGLLDRLDLREGDAAALPFPDDTFAFVGSAQVFEYVPDVARAVSQAYRVLRPGGRLALINTDWRTLRSGTPTMRTSAPAWRRPGRATSPTITCHAASSRCSAGRASRSSGSSRSSS